jgi:hypothetical protein
MRLRKLQLLGMGVEYNMHPRCSKLRSSKRGNVSIIEFSSCHRSHFGSRYPLGLMRTAQAFLRHQRFDSPNGSFDANAAERASAGFDD